MQAINVPALLPLAWATNAASGFVRSIPTASQIGIQDGAASLNDGYPPLTLTPEASGGVPPFGQDTNGILLWMTQILQWLQAGGPARYNATFSGNIAGYPKGTVLQSSALDGRFWRNTVEANTTDPDGVSAAGWVSFFAPVFVNPTFTGTTTVNGPAVFGSTVNLAGAAQAVTQAQNSALAYVATGLYVDRQANTTAANAAADATTKANNAQNNAVNYANATFATFAYANNAAAAAQTNAYNAAVAYVNGYAATPGYVQSQFQIFNNGSQAAMVVGPCWFQFGQFTATYNGSGTVTLYTSFPTTFFALSWLPGGAATSNSTFFGGPINNGQFNWTYPSTVSGGSTSAFYVAMGY